MNPWIIVLFFCLSSSCFGNPDIGADPWAFLQGRNPLRNLPKKEEETCDPKIDLILLIDSSGSVRDFYDLQKNMSAELIDALPVSRDAIRVAAIQYTGYPQVDFTLNTYRAKDDVVRHLREMSFQPGVTRTASALEGAGILLFDNEKGARPNADKIIVLMTDGLSFDTPKDVARKLRKENGVTIYVVSVADDPYYPELYSIAGAKKNVFNRENLPKLRNILSKRAETLTDNCKKGSQLKNLASNGTNAFAILTTEGVESSKLESREEPSSETGSTESAEQDRSSAKTTLLTTSFVGSSQSTASASTSNSNAVSTTAPISTQSTFAPVLFETTTTGKQEQDLTSSTLSQATTVPDSTTASATESDGTPTSASIKPITDSLTTTNVRTTTEFIVSTTTGKPVKDSSSSSEEEKSTSDSRTSAAVTSEGATSATTYYPTTASLTSESTVSPTTTALLTASAVSRVLTSTPSTTTAQLESTTDDSATSAVSEGTVMSATNKTEKITTPITKITQSTKPISTKSVTVPTIIPTIIASVRTLFPNLLIITDSPLNSAGAILLPRGPPLQDAVKCCNSNADIGSSVAEPNAVVNADKNQTLVARLLAKSLLKRGRQRKRKGQLSNATMEKDLSSNDKRPTTILLANQPGTATQTTHASQEMTTSAHAITLVNEVTSVANTILFTEAALPASKETTITGRHSTRKGKRRTKKPRVSTAASTAATSQESRQSYSGHALLVTGLPISGNQALTVTAAAKIDSTGPVTKSSGASRPLLITASVVSGEANVLDGGNTYIAFQNGNNAEINSKSDAEVVSSVTDAESPSQTTAATGATSGETEFSKPSFVISSSKSNSQSEERTKAPFAATSTSPDSDSSRSSTRRHLKQSKRKHKGITSRPRVFRTQKLHETQSSLSTPLSPAAVVAPNSQSVFDALRNKERNEILLNPGLGITAGQGQPRNVEASHPQLGLPPNSFIDFSQDDAKRRDSNEIPVIIHSGENAHTFVSKDGLGCPLDIFILLDSSTSATKNYDASKDFIHSLVKELNIAGKSSNASNQQRVALLQFSGLQSQRVEFSFDTHKTNEAVQKAVDKMEHLTGTAAIGKALEISGNMLSMRRQHNRPTIVLAMTDGQSQDNALLPASYITKFLKIPLYAISLGEPNNRELLAKLTGQQEAVFIGPEQADAFRRLLRFYLANSCASSKVISRVYF